MFFRSSHRFLFCKNLWIIWSKNRMWKSSLMIHLNLGSGSKGARVLVKSGLEGPSGMGNLFGD